MLHENVSINRNVIEVIGIFIGGFISAMFARRIKPEITRAKGYSRVKRLIFAFLGGILIAFGTRLARGCTSGQALDGAATMSVGAWIFMLSAFLGCLGFL